MEFGGGRGIGPSLLAWFRMSLLPLCMNNIPAWPKYLASPLLSLRWPHVLLCSLVAMGVW